MIELAKEARLRPVYAMGHLHSLWHEALMQQEDGDLSKWSDEFIAEACDYPGDAPQWVRLLQKHGWLNGRVIHDWLDYAGRYLELKYRRGDLQKLRRIWAKHRRRYKPGNSQASAGPPNLTNPSPNQDNLTLGKQARTSAGETATTGFCDYKYADGTKCSQYREPRAFFCRDHIEKFRELKDKSRGPGFQQAGEILGEKQ